LLRRTSGLDPHLFDLKKLVGIFVLGLLIQGCQERPDRWGPHNVMLHTFDTDGARSSFIHVVGDLEYLRIQDAAGGIIGTPFAADTNVSFGRFGKRGYYFNRSSGSNENPRASMVRCDLEFSACETLFEMDGRLGDRVEWKDSKLLFVHTNIIKNPSEMNGFGWNPYWAESDIFVYDEKTKEIAQLTNFRTEIGALNLVGNSLYSAVWDEDLKGEYGFREFAVDEADKLRIGQPGVIEGGYQNRSESIETHGKFVNYVGIGPGNYVYQICITDTSDLRGCLNSGTATTSPVIIENTVYYGTWDKAAKRLVLHSRDIAAPPERQ
jgi:hypothetical protein